MSDNLNNWKENIAKKLEDALDRTKDEDPLIWTTTKEEALLLLSFLKR